MNGKKLNFNNIFLFVFVGSVFMILSGALVYFWQKSYSDEEKTQIIYSNNKNTYAETADLKKKLDRARNESLEKEKASTENATAGSQSFKYASLDYNLTLPTAWSGYSVKEEVYKWEYSGSSKAVEFGFNNVPLFVIYKIEKDQWILINKKETEKPIYLGDNEQYVFAYTSVVENSSQEYSDKVNEIPLIIQSFRINKNAN